MRVQAAALLASVGTMSWLVAGCSDATDASAESSDDGSGLVVVDAGGADEEVDVGPEVDVERRQPCPDRCDEEMPDPPACQERVWDLKACTCRLVDAEEGAPCDDGDSCTVGDSCSEGRCVAGEPDVTAQPETGWIPEGTPLLALDDPARDLSPIHVPGGCVHCDGRRAYAHVGGAQSWADGVVPLSAKGIAIAEFYPARLTALEASLEKRWVGESLADRGLRTVIGLSGGGFAAVGQALQTGTSKAGWIARFDADGMLEWEHLLLDTYSMSVLGVAEAPSGDVVAVGTGSDEDGEAYVYRFAPHGDPEWKVSMGPGTTSIPRQHGVAFCPDGDPMIAYTLRESQTGELGESFEAIVPIIARLEPTGAIVWSRRLGAQMNTGAGAAMTPIAEDRFLVAAYQVPSFSDFTDIRLAIWIVDADGEVLHERSHRTAHAKTWPRVDGVARMPDGGAVLAVQMLRWLGDGKIPLKIAELIESDVYLVKLDAFGNFQWARRYGEPGNHADRLFGGAVATGGDVTTAGTMEGEGGDLTKTWILRTDPWGRTCGMYLGACADKTLEDCADGNPCTVDWCDPDEGCTHPPLPDGSPCGEDATCSGGVCQP